MLPDGTAATVLSAEHDRRPFALRPAFDSDGLGVSVDLVNFASQEDLARFAEELGSISEFEQATLGRKAAVPEPEVLIQIPRLLIEHPYHVLLAYFLGTTGRRAADRAAEQIGNEVGEDLSRLYRFLRQVPLALLRRARPNGRPATCVYVVPGEPTVQFVVRSQTAEVFDRAVDLPRMRELVDQARDFRERFGAREFSIFTRPRRAGRSTTS